MLKWSHMTQTHLADRQISQPSESSGLKLCGTNQKLDNWVPEFSANEKKKGLNARLQLKCTRTRSTLYEAKDAWAAYCAALSLYAGWHTRFVASGVDRVSLLEKKERMKERKGSPWQQLLQFVGSNMCDDIIQHHWSEVPADAYPLYLSVKISSFEKKEKTSPVENEISALCSCTRHIQKLICR